MNKSLSKIILVESNIEIIEILRELIDPLQFEMIAYTDTKKALLALQAEKVDALICEFYMPNSLGHELLDACEKSGNLPPTVVVLLGHTLEAESSLQFRKKFYCLEKPFFIPELLKILAKIKNRAS